MLTLRSVVRLSCFVIPLIYLSQAHSAPAAVKAYDMAPTVGGPFSFSPPGGDYILRSPTISPSVLEISNLAWGRFFLEDDSGGSVSASELSFGVDTSNTELLSGFMGGGPGAYVHIRTRTTATTLAAGAGSGATGPASQIDWGVLSGWTQTGTRFCRSTPPFVCTFIDISEDGSIPFPVLGSTSYDLGTWSFDAAGDFEATPYILDSSTQVVSGPIIGTQVVVSNTLAVLRGRFFGSSLPALPIVGLGGLTIALLVVAGRSIRTTRSR